MVARPLLLAFGLVLAACAPTPAAGGRPAQPAPPGPPPAAGAASPPAAASPQRALVRYASQFSSGDTPMFLAAERGYLQQEGVDLEFVRFGNASEMIPALATGQVEAGSAGSNPATWNAVARGIPLKLVLDRGTFRPGWGDQALVIRKAVYDARPVQSLADLRGLTLAATPPGKGTASGCALAAGLQRVGLTLDDVNLQAINFPDMLAALANGAIDGALLNEPFLARALGQGTAVRAVDIDQMYPNFTISAVVFGPQLYQQRDVAKGVVRAYIRGIREFLAARTGSGGALTNDEIDAIVSKYTGIEPAFVREMSPPGFNPNGLPNRDALLYCYQFFRAEGMIPEPASEQALAAVWGTDLVEEALAEIGRAPEP
ncbi:MAG TPA: ABC transporter substrate-binding protein [Chloroflexota bacterium]|jgi:NitT/TauT family transport system substrate-binding protein|nr:ABC transporter substrate-binding protein [Chloroflexota bacterium]